MNKKYKQIGWLVTTKHSKNTYIPLDQIIFFHEDMIPIMEKNGCSFKAVYEEEV